MVREGSRTNLLRVPVQRLLRAGGAVVRVRKKWGKLDVELAPDVLERYSCVYVDFFSVAKALKDAEELFRGFAQFPGRAVFVLDAWHESHLPLARRYRELCEKWGLNCVLSEDKPAEEKAVELACREGCAVLTRDFDAVRKALELNCNAPVLMARGGRVYRAAQAALLTTARRKN